MSSFCKHGVAAIGCAECNTPEALAEIARLKAEIAQADLDEKEQLDLLSKARGEIARLKALDDPEADATDFAHPAWWRGEQHACVMFCLHVNAILDGKDDGIGKNSPGEWADTRQRLLLAAAGLKGAVGFIENLRVPQNTDEAGLLIFKGSKVLETLNKALKKGGA